MNEDTLHADDVAATSPRTGLSVVLPALDEAPNIAASVRSALHLADRLDLTVEVIVVDDGSTDDTPAVVRALAGTDDRVRLVSHARNRGYGAALESGFRAARGQLVFFTDADLQFDIAELSALLPWSAEFPIVAGYRAQRQDPWHRRMNAWAWGRLVGRMFDLRVRDVNCAFKLFHRDVLCEMPIRAAGAFVNTEILARARQRGYAVKQVPVNHFPRPAGSQTGARPRVVARAFVELARLRRDVSPA